MIAFWRLSYKKGGRTKGVTVKGEDAASHGDEAGRGIWATVMAIKKKN